MNKEFKDCFGIKKNYKNKSRRDSQEFRGIVTKKVLSK